MRVALVLPPSKVSHGPDTFRAMPDVHLTVIADREFANCDASVVLPSRRVPIAGSPVHWTAALAWLRGLDHVELGDIDVVASLELYSVSSMQAQRLARRLGVPHVVRVTENLPDNDVFKLPPWRAITKQIAAEASGFLCVTAQAKAAGIRHGTPADRCSVVYHGVDTSIFSPRPGGLTAEPKILFVGELRPDKGVLDVIAACDRLQGDAVDLQLQIVGDGPLRDAVTAAAATRPWLDFDGRRARAEIPDLLRGSRVAIVASKARRRWAEQFGFALVEAMACGLPVVATRSGAIPEVVPAWNPLATEGDSAGLADGLRAALGPEGEKWGARNRAFVERYYELGQQGVEMRAAISSVLDGHHLAA